MTHPETDLSASSPKPAPERPLPAGLVVDDRLPDGDVAILDEHLQRSGLRSRSAAIHQAIRLLRQSGLEDDYAAAWEEWERSGERELWERVTADGLS